jgi:glyceraldehyde 3-phosphate dehydrogenase
MTVRVAITGFGRIGRLVLRAIYEEKRSDVKVVAINGSSRGTMESNLHLLKYDSAHGRFDCDISMGEHEFSINGDTIKYYATRDPEELPWGELDVDVVLECTGAFRSKKLNMVHLHQGAKKVLISAPGESDVDATIVYGVNHDTLQSSHTVVSNASCTTNGLAPIVHVLNENYTIKSGLMNTIHSFTNDQALLDNIHKDIRRARTASSSMVPTKTGAASAVGLVIPELKGKLDGVAIRVPTANVSLVDLTLNIAEKVTAEEVNAVVKKAADNELKDILVYSDIPLVSVDYNHTPASSYFDSLLTKVSSSGDLVKVFGWYDNEYGFSCRMLDTAVAMMNAN